MHSHRAPSQLFSYLATKKLLLRAVLPRSFLLLIELMLTTYDRRSAQCGQACTGKARHHNQIARLGHVAARGLGSCSRRGRGGHRFGVILLLDLVASTALVVVFGLFLFALGLALVLLLSGLVVLLLRARTLIGFGLLGSLVLGVALYSLDLFLGNLVKSCPCSGPSRY